MQLRGASFILRMKSRVLLRSEVGMIMVSICLHGVISSSQASGRGRFGPTKTVIAEKYHPSVLKFCLTWTVYNISNKMTKFYDDAYSFLACEGCQFLKLYISMFEKWLESPQWLLAVSKPKVRMRVTSASGQEFVHCEIAYFYSMTVEKWLVVSLPNFVTIRRTHLSISCKIFSWFRTTTLKIHAMEFCDFIKDSVSSSGLFVPCLLTMTSTWRPRLTAHCPIGERH